ncbi:hypothetical protein WGM54_14740 [Paenibacillus polymyxa]|uniref:hypothetical protein n=1 Tax=Paenibacillus polymyxa TaxID=1406 RepID=UPI00307D8C68
MSNLFIDVGFDIERYSETRIILWNNEKKIFKRITYNTRDYRYPQIFENIKNICTKSNPDNIYVVDSRMGEELFKYLKQYNDLNSKLNYCVQDFNDFG